IACLFPEMEPLVGYALPIRIRTNDPPIGGVSDIHDMEWTSQLLSIPHPRILVIEDAQAGPRSGSFLGEVHANVYAALGCIGVITNGAVRDLPALRGLHFHAHASHVSVSHAYVHIVEVGAPVVIGGLQVQAGDLLHGDQHGILTIPLDVASDLPAIAAQQKQRELEIIDFCRSPLFTIDGLTSLLQGMQK
ncbi:MAG: RraA family protein, partial [Betaproteobacteria bacterium]